MATAKRVSRRRPTSRSTTRRAGNDIVTTTMVRVHLPGAGRRSTKAKSTGTRRRTTRAKAKGGRRTRR